MWLLIHVGSVFHCALHQTLCPCFQAKRDYVTSLMEWGHFRISRYIFKGLQLGIFSCDQAALRTHLSVRLSVRPSVCHTFFTTYLSSYHHEIFRSYYQQVLELMQMHPKERLRRVILIASRYSTGLKLENYYFFTFTFSWPEVGKLFHIYFFLLFLFLDLKLENYSIFTFLLFLKLKLGNYSVVTFLLFLDQKLENYSIFRWLSARLQ